MRFRLDNLKIKYKIGTWRSLVAHYLGVVGVASSNLVVPTIYKKTFSYIYKSFYFLNCSQCLLKSVLSRKFFVPYSPLLQTQCKFCARKQDDLLILKSDKNGLLLPQNGLKKFKQYSEL